MKATAVISNFNIFPIELTKWFPNHVIFDQSTDLAIWKVVSEKFPSAIRTVNSGHSLSHYFQFIYENYEDLPDHIYLLKSNIMPRHIDLRTFQETLKLDGFVPIFNDINFHDKKGIAHHIMPGYFIENNSSWYIDRDRSKYFKTYNELLSFIFVDPIFPEWVLFAPGGNYLVTKTRILRFPRNFWKFLHHIVTYEFFPPEAYIVERMLFTIFSAPYELRSFFNDDEALMKVMQRLENLKNSDSPQPPITKMKRFLNKLPF